jgi:phytoene synthase
VSEDIDTLVRRVDEDRWLATRFAPEQIRARLIAIYAVNYEIAHVNEVVMEPTLAQIRLTWWRDAIEAIHDGKLAPAHPVLAAYAGAAEGLSPALWNEIIEARSDQVEKFSSWDAVYAYLERTSGAVMKLALLACGTSAEHAFTIVRCAAQAWGYQGCLRSPALRSRLPGDDSVAIARAKAAHASARAIASSLPPAAFPAIGYLSLVPGYLHAIARGRGEQALFMRQATLIGASATGRI